MGFVVLELVRDKNGRVMKVLPVNVGDFVKTQDETGYLQIVGGRVVAHLTNDEIVIAKVREGDPPGE